MFFPLAAQAAGEGAWQASSMGLRSSNRGESMSSRPLSPSEPATGLMTLVAWNY
jgi:flagellar protein FlhE